MEQFENNPLEDKLNEIKYTSSIGTYSEEEMADLVPVGRDDEGGPIYYSQIDESDIKPYLKDNADFDIRILEGKVNDTPSEIYILKDSYSHTFYSFDLDYEDIKASNWKHLNNEMFEYIKENLSEVGSFGNKIQDNQDSIGHSLDDYPEGISEHDLKHVGEDMQFDQEVPRDLCESDNQHLVLNSMLYDGSARHDPCFPWSKVYNTGDYEILKKEELREELRITKRWGIDKIEDKGLYPHFYELSKAYDKPCSQNTDIFFHHVSLKENSPVTTKELIEKGHSNIDAFTSKRFNAENGLKSSHSVLEYSIMIGNNKVFKELLDAGASTTYSKDEKTGLDQDIIGQAIYSGNDEAFSTIIERDPNAVRDEHSKLYNDLKHYDFSEILGNKRSFDEGPIASYFNNKDNPFSLGY